MGKQSAPLERYHVYEGLAAAPERAVLRFVRSYLWDDPRDVSMSLKLSRLRVRELDYDRTAKLWVQPPDAPGPMDIVATLSATLTPSERRRTGLHLSAEQPQPNQVPQRRLVVVGGSLALNGDLVASTLPEASREPFCELVSMGNAADIEANVDLACRDTTARGAHNYLGPIAIARIALK